MFVGSPHHIHRPISTLQDCLHFLGFQSHAMQAVKFGIENFHLGITGPDDLHVMRPTIFFFFFFNYQVVCLVSQIDSGNSAAFQIPIFMSTNVLTVVFNLLCTATLVSPRINTSSS